MKVSFDTSVALDTEPPFLCWSILVHAPIYNSKIPLLALLAKPLQHASQTFRLKRCPLSLSLQAVKHSEQVLLRFVINEYQSSREEIVDQSGRIPEDVLLAKRMRTLKWTRWLVWIEVNHWLLFYRPGGYNISTCW